MMRGVRGADLCPDLSTHARGKADDAAGGGISKPDGRGDFVHAGLESFAFFVLAPLHAPLYPGTVRAV